LRPPVLAVFKQESQVIFLLVLLVAAFPSLLGLGILVWVEQTPRLPNALRLLKQLVPGSSSGWIKLKTAEWRAANRERCKLFETKA
jgi:hypothetical protein